MSPIHHWLATLYFKNIGPVRIRRWLNHFGSLEKLFAAHIEDLQLAKLTPNQITEIKNPNWRAAERDLAWCTANDCQIITDESDEYPALLRELHDAPLILFAKGDIKCLHQPQIAIVGSRNPSPNGKELSEQFAYALAKAGVVITSGLALGIDAHSHQGALAADGLTIGVLGTGLKNIYPASNRKLAEQIAKQGLLLSEFPPDMPPHAQNFPRRNRIISGLSLGVLVIEAALRSGSLITAHLAAEQGREVFAIPGSIHNPLAKGCHKLIQEGAKLIEKAEDILEELGALLGAMKAKNGIRNIPTSGALDAKQTNFLSYIGYEATPVDMIILRSALTASEVSSILLSLELRGYVRLVPGGYARCPS